MPGTWRDTLTPGIYKGPYARCQPLMNIRVMREGQSRDSGHMHRGQDHRNHRIKCSTICCAKCTHARSRAPTTDAAREQACSLTDASVATPRNEHAQLTARFVVPPTQLDDKATKPQAAVARTCPRPALDRRLKLALRAVRVHWYRNRARVLAAWHSRSALSLRFLQQAGSTCCTSQQTASCIATRKSAAA